MSRLLRGLGLFDVASGVAALALGPWLARQLDVPVTTVRLVGAFLVVLGAAKALLSDRPAMPAVASVVEIGFALAALAVAIEADPTAIGTALLVGTAGLCLAVAATLLVLDRRSADRETAAPRPDRLPHPA